MLRYLTKQAFSSLPTKKNFTIDYLQGIDKLFSIDIELITRDYKGSLKSILKTFTEHKINLSCLETRKLNNTSKYLLN